MNERIKEQLQEMEYVKLSENNPTWNISWDTGEFLTSIIQENNLTSGLEIGGSTGFSALFLASALEANDGKFITTESSPKRIPILEENLGKSKLSNITLLKGHAPEILEEVSDKKFDFVFLDATKYEYISYIKYLLDNNLLHGNAIIVADNIISHEKKLEEYIYFMETHPDFENELVEIGTGLLISKSKL